MLLDLLQVFILDVTWCYTFRRDLCQVVDSRDTIQLVISYMRIYFFNARTLSVHLVSMYSRVSINTLHSLHFFASDKKYTDLH